MAPHTSLTPKKRGRPVGSKKEVKLSKLEQDYGKWEFDEIEVPTLRRIRCDDCVLDDKPKMSLADKITWVLTAVNIAILISLVIRNI